MDSDQLIIPENSGNFPPSFPAGHAGILETILSRAADHPVLVASTAIFAMAVAHTFATPIFQKISHDMGRRAKAEKRPPGVIANTLHFLGEVEAVFGIWAVAIFALLAAWPGLGWKAACAYIDGRNFSEAIFVVVIMAMSATRPVVAWTGHILKRVAALGCGTPLAWWLVLLTVTPLLGSFITEPAAMTISAMLLLRRFYSHLPSERLAYATIALLFVNISVGGTLTNFASPPVLMVASPWKIGPFDMLTGFGWKAIIGLVITNGATAFLFRKEFAELAVRARETDAIATDRDDTEPPPFGIFLTHLGFMTWTVFMLLNHHNSLMVAGLLFFIAFTIATEEHQRPVSLKSPLLVGFFLAGLVIHGGLQAWWIGPVLGSLGEWPLFLTTLGLSPFNDNAAITYLASQVPAFSLVGPDGVALAGEALEKVSTLHFAVIAAAVTGGGMTVIANAPNPAGLAILGNRFPGGFSPMKLCLWGIVPTIIYSSAFMLLP